MEEQNIKLTKLTKCAGCGAKVGAGVLAQLLEGIRVHHDSNLLVGFDKSDPTCSARSPPPTPSVTCMPWAASRSCV